MSEERRPELYVEYTYPDDYHDAELAGKTVKQNPPEGTELLPGHTIVVFTDEDSGLVPPDLIPDVGIKWVDGKPLKGNP